MLLHCGGLLSAGCAQEPTPVVGPKMKKKQVTYSVMLLMMSHEELSSQQQDCYQSLEDRASRERAVERKKVFCGFLMRSSLSSSCRPLSLLCPSWLAMVVTCVTFLFTPRRERKREREPDDGCRR